MRTWGHQETDLDAQLEKPGDTKRFWGPQLGSRRDKKKKKRKGNPKGRKKTGARRRMKKNTHRFSSYSIPETQP